MLAPKDILRALGAYIIAFCAIASLASCHRAEAEEPVMIAAIGRDGACQAYTMAQWDKISKGDRAEMQPVGVQLCAEGQKFIIAATGAASGQNMRWEESNAHALCSNVEDLADVDGKADAILDFAGKGNTDAILAFGKGKSLKFESARAAAEYANGDNGLEWFLPSAGQLWLVYKNKDAINKALLKCGGKPLMNGGYWSSTEMDGSSAWVVVMYTGMVEKFNKGSYYWVRAIAHAPGSEG